MYPLASCSFTKSNSAFCSSCISWYTFPGIVEGVFSFSSMAWSQICDSGKCCATSSLKTWECCWYLAGISLLPFCDLACSASLDVSVCFFDVLGPVPLICTHAIYRELLAGAYGPFTLCLPAGVMLHLLMWIFFLSGAHMMSSSCSASIYPLAQLMFGWVAANHGYPRMSFWSSISVRKKHSLILCCPVCISRSV